MLTIDWRDLGIPPDEKPFAEGAVGELYPVRHEVAGLPGRKLVFKRIKKDLPVGLDRDHVLAQMRSVVGHRDTMSAAELADLDDVAVWPLAMVRQAGTEVGIVLDLIDDSFFVDTKPAAGPPGKKLFELQFLCVSVAYFNKLGIDPGVTGDDVMRLALAARLAYAIEVVHRRPVVFGDLHLKNAVAAARPIARVLLMDCDSVAELSDTSRIQLHGPGFVPPEIRDKHQRMQDQQTDVYKLGLCIIRALSPGKGATQATDPAKTTPGILDAEGIDLLQRAVGEARSRRPNASDLREYLVRRIRGKIQLPELVSAELSHRVALRGSDVLVRWQQRGGTKIRIVAAGGFQIDNIDPNSHPAGYAIRPPVPGPVTVEVSNDHGRETLSAGHIDYLDIPALQLSSLQTPLYRISMQAPRIDSDPLATTLSYPLRGKGIVTEAPLTNDVDAAVHGDDPATAPVAHLSTDHGHLPKTAEKDLTDAIRESMRRVADAVGDGIGELIAQAERERRR